MWGSIPTLFALLQTPLNATEWALKVSQTTPVLGGQERVAKDNLCTTHMCIRARQVCRKCFDGKRLKLGPSSLMEKNIPFMQGFFTTLQQLLKRKK